MKLLVYGNCQANPLASLMAIANPELEPVRCPAVHTLKPHQAEQVRAGIAEAEVIVHQPISEKFGPVSSEALKAEFPDKTWISFPSIYVGGLFPQLFYMRRPGKPTMQGPLKDYHDRRIVEAFLAGESVDQAAARLHEPGDYRADFEESFANAAEREAHLDVKVMDIIRELLPRIRPLHTFNHPNNAVLWAAALRALALLGLKPAPGAVPPTKDFCSGMTAMVPRSVRDLCGANWTSDAYVREGETLDDRALVEDFYRTYEAEPDFEQVYRNNLRRFGRSTLQVGG